MTHVDWHPVEVDKHGRILEGKKPKDDSFVYISIDNSTVELIHFEDGIFGEGRMHDWYKRINAWAKVKMPKPYRPEVKE